MEFRWGDRWPVPGAGTRDGLGTFHQIARGELQGRGADPAVDLLRRPAANNSPGNAGPGQRPGHCNGGHRSAMTLRNRAQRIAQRKIPAQVRFIEIKRPPPPIIFGNSCDVFPIERVGQQTGLHRALTDDPGVMLGTPWYLARSGLALDQRERRLQRIDMPNGFASFEQRHIEIADTSQSHFALLD